jgi:predicted phosphate transport protein (TIGR00153 family)
VLNLWRRKDEKEISELIIKHSQVILDTVKTLAQYLELILKKKAKGRLEEEEEELSERVLALESKADRVEEEIDERLRGTALPVTSSERYSLVEKMDSIADRAEIVVRKLRIIDEPIPLKIKEKLCEMGNYCLEATEAVVKSIEFLGSDFDSALAEAQKVRPIRKQNRIVEFDTLGVLVKKKLETSTFVLLHDVIQGLGRIGDRTNEAAHVIISLIIKYRQ